MLSLLLNPAKANPTILLLGAHCDDIEIGCGATVARLARERRDARFVWVTLSSDPVREKETRAAAARVLAGAAECTVIVRQFRGSYFPHEGAALKDFFESLKPYAPDLVFTHFRHDLHQDHRVTHELTWNTFRDHAILEYEIPKYDADLRVPNVYVPLTADEVERKCSMLMDCFPSQHGRAWFTAETFRAVARLRGIECNSPGGYAEGFHGRKLLLCV